MGRFGVRDASARAVWALSLLVLVQMLPATLVTPAIRPLFAARHGGHEGAMHAFMALNMLGGLLAAPWLARRADRSARPRRLLVTACAADALLLALLPAPWPTSVVLLLRTCEGAAHVGAATLLLGEAAALRRALGDERVMGLAGAALMLAIAAGSALGGLVVGLDPRAPFWLGAGLSALVALVVWRRAPLALARPVPAARTGARIWSRALVVPTAAAFVERFAIGCVVVTFGLFAHRAHHVSDSMVGYLFALLTLPFALLMYPAARLCERLPRALVMLCGALLFSASLASLGRVSAGALPGVMLTAGIAAALLFAPTLAYAAAAGEGHARAMAAVNAAGCLGMLLGPAAAGITCALFSRGGRPLDGYRAAFALAALSVVGWAAGSLPWLWRQWRRERAALRPVARLEPGWSGPGWQAARLAPEGARFQP